MRPSQPGVRSADHRGSAPRTEARRLCGEAPAARVPTPEACRRNPADPGSIGSPERQLPGSQVGARVGRSGCGVAPRVPSASAGRRRQHRSRRLGSRRIRCPPGAKPSGLPPRAGRWTEPNPATEGARRGMVRGACARLVSRHDGGVRPHDKYRAELCPARDWLGRGRSGRRRWAGGWGLRRVTWVSRVVSDLRRRRNRACRSPVVRPGMPSRSFSGGPIRPKPSIPCRTNPKLIGLAQPLGIGASVRLPAGAESGRTDAGYRVFRSNRDQPAPASVGSAHGISGRHRRPARPWVGAVCLPVVSAPAGRCPACGIGSRPDSANPEAPQPTGEPGRRNEPIPIDRSKQAELRAGPTTGGGTR